MHGGGRMEEKILVGGAIKELRSQNWKAHLSSYENHHYNYRNSVEERECKPEAKMFRERGKVTRSQ